MSLLVACAPRQAPILSQLDEKLAAMPDPRPPYHDGLVYKSTLWGDVALDLYQPYNHREGAGQRHPVYLHVHGGSWMFGHRKFIRLAEERVEALRENGVAVISIDYRKLQQVGIGGAVDDALSSLQWLVENADKYQLDIQNVVLHGLSAGGHLVLMMGFTHRLPQLKIKLILDDYGPADLVELQHQPMQNRRNILQLYPDFRLRTLSPINHVRPGLPPVQMTHARGDDLVPLAQSESLLQALLDAGNAASLEILELHGPHHGMKNASEQIKRELMDKGTGLILAALRDIEN